MGHTWWVMGELGFPVSLLSWCLPPGGAVGTLEAASAHFSHVLYPSLLVSQRRPRTSVTWLPIRASQDPCTSRETPPPAHKTCGPVFPPRSPTLGPSDHTKAETEPLP